MGKVNASLLEEVKGLSNKEAFELYSKLFKGLSNKEAFELYSKLFETIKSIESNIVEINPKDLEPKRKKRGSKNKK